MREVGNCVKGSRIRNPVPPPTAVDRVEDVLWRYIVSFARYSNLLVENPEIFIPHLYLAPPESVTPSEFCENVRCW